MKIRGTTVGTPIKPESVLSKPVTLSEEQKAQARENIGACEINDNEVRMDKAWSSAQIQAELVDVYAEIRDSVSYSSSQDKTKEEKAQARKNIGAIGDGDFVTELTADFLGVADSEDPSDPGMKRGAYMRYYHDFRGNGTDTIYLIGTETDGVVIAGLAPGVKDTDAVNKGQLDKALSATEMAMVNKLCPSFTETGSVVTCEPVEGYPLTVTAADGATITRCGKNVFGGDALADKMASQGAVKNEADGTVQFHPANVDRATRLFTKFKPNTQYTFMMYGCNIDSSATVNSANLLIVYTDGEVLYIDFDKTAIKENGYLCFISKAGKSIQFFGFCYATGETRLYYDKCGIFEGVVPLEGFEAYQSGTFAQGEQIQALSGVNTLWADSGLLTVSGKADPVARLERLENAILAMGANV